MPENKELTDGEVRQQVRDLVGKDKISWHPHVEERMAKRGYDRGQIKECLVRGIFSERPTIANRRGPIQYDFRMRGTVDGDQIEVGASLIAESHVRVVTVFDPNGWS